MEKLKKEIAPILARLSTDARCIEAGIQEDNEPELVEHSYNKILTLFQDWLEKEIGELKVIGDEEIRFLRDAADIQDSKLLLGNTTILAERAIAQAQLDDVKKHFEKGVKHEMSNLR